MVFIKNSLLYVSVSYEYIVGWCDKCPPASRLSQPFTALKIIKKVEYPVLEESILSLDMPAIDQLLGKWGGVRRRSTSDDKLLVLVHCRWKRRELMDL